MSTHELMSVLLFILHRSRSLYFLSTCRHERRVLFLRKTQYDLDTCIVKSFLGFSIDSFCNNQRWFDDIFRTTYLNYRILNLFLVIFILLDCHSLGWRLRRHDPLHLPIINIVKLPYLMVVKRNETKWWLLLTKSKSHLFYVVTMVTIMFILPLIRKQGSIKDFFLSKQNSPF